MCGIAFSYPAVAPARMASALRQMQHRGPDESDSLETAGGTLGHCRLSIVDLSGSHQPLSSPDGRHVLVYNGEIYNFRELRRELEPAWNFRTDGDTEVMLAGLLLEGDQFLQRVDGMWAYALWDSRDRVLRIGRDRFGKKPLYYEASEDHSALSLASELPVLKSLRENPASEDRNSLADYLRYGFFLPGTTIFAGIRELPPGHVAAWSPGKTMTEQRWWQPPVPSGTADNRPELVERVRETFGTAVRNRMVADVEVGSFLSGGIDSSLVAAYAARQSTGRLRTFSIGFSNADYDETRYARLVAEQIGSLHAEATVEGFEAADLESILAGSVGQPFGDPSLLPTSLVSELASRHVKVALSGDGADELFGGYQRYQGRVLLRWYQRLPESLRRALRFGFSQLPAGRMHHSKSLVKKAQLFTEMAVRDQDEPYVAPRFFSRNELEELLPGAESLGHETGLPEQTSMSDLEQMMHADALVYLPQDILLKVDRASMRHSLEVRAPFLGKEIAELAMSIGHSHHLRPGSGKRLLREAFSRDLPREIWSRRKQGFAVPVSHWFAGQLGDRLLQLLDSDPGPLNERVVRRLLADHRNRVADNGLRLWVVFTYLAWRNGSWQ